MRSCLQARRCGVLSSNVLFISCRLILCGMRAGCVGARFTSHSVTTASGVRNDAESTVVERTGKADCNGRVLAAVQSRFFMGPPRFARASSFARAAFPSANSCSINGAWGGGSPLTRPVRALQYQGLTARGLHQSARFGPAAD